MVTRRSAIAKRSTAKPQTVGEKLAARAKKFVQMRRAEKAKAQPSAFARKKNPAGGAAAGGAGASSSSKSASSSSSAASSSGGGAASAWQPVVDPSSGSTYYYVSCLGLLSLHYRPLFLSGPSYALG